MPNRKLLQRITDAVTELREPIATKTLGDIEVKAQPSFGQGYYSGDRYGDGFRWNGWGPNFQRGRLWDTNIDYKRETGPLDTSSLVMAVCNWTGVQLPEAPPVVMVPDGKGGKQPEASHPCSDLVRRPNPFSIWADDCLAGALSWWIDGNWYMLKVRNELTREVLELWYLPHFMVEPRWPNDGIAPEVPAFDGQGNPSNPYLSHYQFTVPGRAPVLYPASDIVHIKRGKNPAITQKGIGAFDPVMKEIYGDNKASLFAATILKNLGIVVPLLTPKDKDVVLTPEQAQSIKEQWAKNTTGDNSGRPVVNTIAVDVTKFAWSPQELDLKELRKVPESRIAAVTGIPAAMLQFMVGLEHGTSFAAYAQAREQGYESVIVPIQKAIAEQLTWQLLRSEFKGSEKADFSFDTTKVRVLQEDRDKLYEREANALNKGGITINQFLESVGKETFDGGDVYLIPRTSLPMTLDTLKEIAADPTVLQNAMPAEQALNATPNDPNAPVGPKPKLRAVKGSSADVDEYLASLDKQMEGFTL